MLKPSLSKGHAETALKESIKKTEADLIIANKELVFQNQEKEKRAAELKIADKELVYQKDQKGKRAAELAIANKELVYQNEEKEKRAAELIIANKELSFQNNEKEKRAAELAIANEKLLFQNDEKEKRASELNKVNRLYAFISQVNQNIVRVKNEEVLFHNACSIAFEYGKFKIAWIGIFGDGNKRITCIEQMGIADGHNTNFKNIPLLGDGPQEYISSTGKYYLCNDILNDPELAEWKPLAIKQGISSCMILPIKKSGVIIGSFNLYAAELNFFNKEEVALVVQVTGDISFALDLFEKEKTHKLTQELVVQNEKRYRTLIEKSTDMITLSTQEGELIYGSNSTVKGLGYPAKELLNMSVFDIIHPDEIPGVIEKRDKILKTPGKSFYYQQRRKHKNGKWIWCEGTLTNMLHEPGINAMVSNFRDISEKKRLESAFEDERLRFYDLFLQAPSCMGMLRGRNHIFEMANPLYLKLIGKKDIIGKPLRQILPEVAKQGIIKILDEVYKTGKTFSANEMLVKLDRGNDGILVDTYLNFTYQAYKNTEGIFGGIFFFAVDVTEQVLSRKKIEESEIRYRQIVETAQEGIWLLDETNKTTFVNKKMCELLEYDEQEILGMTNLSFKDEKGQRLALERLKIARQGINETHDTRFITKSGRHIWAHVSSNSIFDNGAYHGLLLMVTDITNRKLIEQRLANSESGLKKAQIIANLGNFEIDMVSYEEIWSDQMYEILGVENKPVAVTESFYTFIHPDDLHVAWEAYTSFRDAAMDYRLIRKDGVLRYVNSEWRFEFDKNNKPVRLYGIMQDITDRKLAEIEHTKMTSDMLLRNSELEQFSYIISHNLRSPVANIIGAAEALSDPDLTAEEKIILNRGISISVTKLDNVVRDLNHILEIKGEMNDTKEIVHFSTLVDDIKFSIKNLIDKNGIMVEYEFSEINEFLTLRAYLYSIFYNLISNSVKYCKPHIPCVITIKSRLEKNKMELIFTDNGLGIDLDKNGGNVFGLYKRFHTNVEGKGMGLYMVKTQVERLGGKISIKSAENKGTEFKIEFEI